MKKKISVVIPAYGECPHLRETVIAILNGSFPPDEVIISASGPVDPTSSLTSFGSRVKRIYQRERLLGGAARNRGAKIASGDYLAFIDADVHPDPQCIESLYRRIIDGEKRFVVGSVGYVTSGGYWGLSNWFCEFSEVAPWNKPREIVGGASASMMVDAQSFADVGGFNERFQPAEDTLLFAQLREQGYTQWYEPGGCVRHHNLPGFARCLSHQYRLGYHSGAVRQLTQLKGSIASKHPAIAIIIWIPRALLIIKRALYSNIRFIPIGIMLIPGITLGSLFWGFGFINKSLSKNVNYFG